MTINNFTFLKPNSIRITRKMRKFTRNQSLLRVRQIMDNFRHWDNPINVDCLKLYVNKMTQSGHLLSYFWIKRIIFASWTTKMWLNGLILCCGERLRSCKLTNADILETLKMSKVVVKSRCRMKRNRSCVVK